MITGQYPIDCPWEKIDSFVSPRELRRFFQWMNEQIADGEAAEIPAHPDQQIQTS
jgi:hypothetical protein